MGAFSIKLARTVYEIRVASTNHVLLLLKPCGIGLSIKLTLSQKITFQLTPNLTPPLAVEDENKVKVTDISIEAKNQSEGMSEEAKAQAFAGMKETMKKLEQNLEDVGREMPEKLESLQTTIESVTTVLENKGKSTIEDEITARENEDPQTKKRRRSGGGIGNTAEKVFDKFVSHVGR